MPCIRRVLLGLVALVAAASVHSASAAPVLQQPEGGPPDMRDDALARQLDIGAVEDEVQTAEVRMALPVEARTESADPEGVDRSQQQLDEWRVDDGTPALYANLDPGPDHGFANRFDPTDSWDTDDIPPRPLTIARIHFYIHTNEPTGPVELHIWEDNGGHKPMETADLIEPLVVTGAPGENIVDLRELGSEVLIDPPRMFHVGVAHKENEATSPDIMLDSGLPFIGSTGDFHGSIKYEDDYCGVQWSLLSVGDIGDGEGSRSPAWMIWLDVEWLEPPEELYFTEADGGAFDGGSRVAWGDYDGDGYDDLLASGSRLYHNEGDGTFVDVTSVAGIYDTGAGAIWADYDNDGDLDFYQYTSQCVPCGQTDNYDDLWRNDGDGTFTNVRDAEHGGRADAPIPRDPLPTEGATWGDFNGDGYLDLYAANHVDWDSGACFDDYLWLNEGPPSFTFRDVSLASGIRSVRLCGRGVNAADFDDDGDTDIFVSNYRLNPDLLWVNTGTDEGVPMLVNEARDRGVEGRRTESSPSDAYAHSIGSVWGDVDQDDDLDMVAARLAHSAWLCFSDVTGFYQSVGAAGEYVFEERRLDAGIQYNEVHSDPSLVDFDNDGHLDLHITHVYDGWRSSTYRNLGTVPTTYEDITHLSGIWPRRGWGSGWSDYDRDGDLDFAARGLWQNAADANGNHWLQVDVSGCGVTNRDALGADVRVTAAGMTQRRHIVSARGTGSQDSAVQHFGLANAEVADEVVVTFPSGQSVTLSDVPADQRLSVAEMGAILVTDPIQAFVNRPFLLIADTCGVERTVTWDLDDDGAFGNGEGSQVEMLIDELGPYPVAAKIEDGHEQVIVERTLQVIEYVATPTLTPTITPTPTEGPSPTPDFTRYPPIYVPFAARTHPPVPSGPPVIYPINDEDGDGNYTVGWSTVARALIYVLEEDHDSLFEDPTEAYRGGKTWVDLTGRTEQPYCYRVRAANSHGSTKWSEPECVHAGEN